MWQGLHQSDAKLKYIELTSNARSSLLLFVGLIAMPASAYLDPGTGSMILQGLIAGIAIAWFTIKNYWYKLTAFFGKKKEPSSVLDDETE